MSMSTTDTDARFVREPGHPWHFLRPNGRNARCGTRFDANYYPQKGNAEYSDVVPPEADRCTRNGCRHAFKLV